MDSEGPYHKGEIAIQEAVGERAQALMNSVVIKDEILTGAINFIERQPLMVLATENANGQIWASMLFGKPGFIRALSTKELLVDLLQAKEIDGDPFLENLASNPRIGALLIELDTRRRLKINGRVSRQNEQEILIAVEESFPLCPKYIQRRKVRLPEDGLPHKQTPELATGTSLGAEELELIANCDTMFSATSNPQGNLDISHRGGKPGFVRAIHATRLRVPDFAGNSMFNSFGNLQLNDRAGVILLDFAGRQCLQICGRATVLLAQSDPQNKTGGTNRFWELEVENWQRTTIPAIELEFLDASPHNPK
ncbi:MAG TPA: pyridoxamine 5'-phosphate oxidase family protein [Candidatus Obscuribacter sp.]|nr:pyridoxamine 5'-phosphate oxidase family protein [Candidatus Obscuribacter sp.]HND07920.1 pyridoxamine 5'-phosphate oxidase family protein [Candidatus Obscuribacter sp.]HNG76905.1 pyridoxamine 5'-phosphate oxidase family protein [Candidatus Obscuribacter sp.]